MNSDLAAQASHRKKIVANLVDILSSQTVSDDDVIGRARGLAAAFNYTGDLNSLIEEVRVSINTTMDEGVSLIDSEVDHDSEWVKKRDVEWVYQDSYERFLIREGWSQGMVRSLSDVSEKLLGHLQDPKTDGDWDRRGLVIGNVQSGKTANYLSLITRAADAGYKFIIVIAGIHNNLRTQTQQRVEEGFIGRSRSIHNRTFNNVGVGLFPDYRHPVSITNVNSDFSKSVADQSGWSINDIDKKPVVLVIKKNASILNSLLDWLIHMNAKDGKITDVPFLLIDDESDNASINTNKPEFDPTRINALLRRILGLFTKSCYVGYTATPFANIFIDPDSYGSDEVRRELFPKDFIHCLDAPSSYFGPDRVFLEDESSDKILKIIDDCEDFLPISHKSSVVVSSLPPSLYKAVNQFIVARAIRNIRGQKTKHCSMMVNVSRFVAVQRMVRNEISLYLKKLNDAVKANYALPESASSGNAIIQSLKAAFEQEYAEAGVSWDRVKSELYAVTDGIRLLLINSSSDERLDYSQAEKDGVGLTVITVGGLSLSRGLTLEGLCVSYMYRNTKMYDTLLQMGRWFGYRTGYDDLCAVYLPQASIDWYTHIAGASDELRQQVKRMSRDGLSPTRFGLYVKDHPDSLLVTARNKMHSATKITVSQNLSGKLIETSVLSADCDVNEKNRKLVLSALDSGFGGTLEELTKGWIVRDVKAEDICDFIRSFQTPESFDVNKRVTIKYLEMISEEYPFADVVFISIDRGEKEFPLGYQERSVSLTPANTVQTSKGRVAGKGDESLGLSDEQKEQARENALESGKKIADYHYRDVRNKPLLMIHILKPKNDKLETEQIGLMPAFGIRFPDGNYDKSVDIDVMANSVWMKENYFDNEEEDDLDY